MRNLSSNAGLKKKRTEKAFRIVFGRLSECRQSLHSEQTERNAGGFDAFFLVGVVIYGRGKNASESNDGGHLPAT